MFHFDDENQEVKRESVFEKDKELVCQLVRAVPNFQGWIHPKLSRRMGDAQQREALVVNFEQVLETIAPNSYEAIKDTLDENFAPTHPVERSDLDSPRPPPHVTRMKKTRRFTL